MKNKFKNFSKKTISILLAVLIVFTALPMTAISAFASEDEKQSAQATTKLEAPKYYYSGDYKYTINDDDTATIYWNGIYSVTEVAIPSEIDGHKVTVLGENAFYRRNYYGDNYLQKLKKVTIPDTVISIGKSAFYDCGALTDINIPNGVVSIGDKAFKYCKTLSEITIPNSVQSIGIETFMESYLKKVFIPTSVNYIGDAAFSNCRYLKIIEVDDSNAYYSDIDGVLFNKEQTLLHTYPRGKYQENYTIPDSVIEVNECAFYNARIYGTLLLDGVEKINDSAFNGCDLKKISIPGSVKSIGNSAFAHCYDLEIINIFDGVTSIGRYAFCDCDALTDINIPNSVTSIGYGAFCRCDKLESAKLSENIQEIPGELFCSCEKLKSIDIPYGVISIGDSAFNNCQSLSDVTIPNSVTNIDDRAFYKCYSLIEIEIPESVTTIGEYVFAESSDLKKVTMTDSVTDIGKKVFYWCGKLESIVFSKNIKSIPERAFYMCENLKSINISDKVTSIGESAFYYCKSLTSIDIPDSVTDIGTYAFSLCESLQTVKLSENISTISEYLFNGCKSLKNIEIPKNVTKIEKYAFSKCDSLNEVYIHSRIKSIGSGAFSGCNSLANINVDANNTKYLDIDGVLFSKDRSTIMCYPEGKGSDYSIPNGTTRIAQSAFYFCDTITNIVMPNSVKYIDRYAFEYCKALTALNIPNSVERIESYVFSHSGIEKIVIPDSVKFIDRWAFSSCESLTNVVISKNLKTIDEYTFQYCKSLTSIVIPKSVTNVNLSAFKECTALKDVYYMGTQTEWDKIDIYTNFGDNYALKRANKHFSVKGDIVNIFNGTININAFDENQLDNSAAFDMENAKLYGVTITADGKSEKFDKTINLTDEYKGKELLFSRYGMCDYIVPSAVTQSWFDKNQYSKNIYMRQDRTSKPYVSTVFAVKKGSDKTYTELCHEELTSMEDAEYDIVMSANLKGAADAVYYLSQDDYHKVSSANGVFSSVKLSSVFQKGKPVYAYVKTTDGQTSETIKLNLNISDMKPIEDTFSLIGKDGQSAKLSDSHPLVGGADISFAGFKFPLGVSVTGNQFKISFGVDIFSLANSTGKWKNDTWASFKKSVATINDTLESAEDKLNTFSRFYDTLIPGSSMMNKNKNFDVNMLGYAEGNIVNGKLIFTSFCGDIATKFKFEYTQQGLIGVIPAYAGVGAGAEVAIHLSEVRALPDKEVPFDFGFALNIIPELKLKAGVGVEDVISAGLYGSGTLPIMNDFTQRHQVVKVTGDVGVEAAFLLWKAQISLAKGETVLWDRYYGNSSKMLQSGVNGINTRKISFGEPTVTLVSRDYAENTSQWLDNKIMKRFSRMFTTNEAGAVTRELQTSVYDNSQTQLISLDDGRMMMAWIEDGSDRDTYNRLRLVYSIYDNGAWSAPKAVNDDGTNDGTPVLASDGKNVYIAWQNFNSTMNENYDFVKIMETSEVCLGKYDAEKDCFSNVKSLTNNKTYDYMPSVDVENGEAVVYWVNNNCNNLNEKGVNTIYKYSTKDEKTNKIKSEANYILDMACVLHDGLSEVSYSMDSDGNTSTTNDIKVYAVSSEKERQITPNNEETENADFNVVYGKIDGGNAVFFADNYGIYYEQNGEIKKVFSSPRSIGGNLQVTDNGKATSVVWTETENNKTELWCSTYENNKWSEPVKISNEGKTIHDLSVVYHNGILHGVFDRTDILVTEDGKTKKGQTDLCYMTVGDYSEIEINFGVINESSFVKGEKAQIPIQIKNNGTKEVKDIQIVLKDGLNYSEKTNCEINLPSGESKVIYVNYIVPENYQSTTMSAEVSIAGEKESNTEDNVALVEIGYADISVGTVSVDSVGEFYVMSAVLSNDTPMQTGNIEVDVRLGSKDGKIIDTLNVGVMEPNSKKEIQYLACKDALEHGEDNLQQIYFVASIKAEETTTSSKTQNLEKITEDNFSGAVLNYDSFNDYVLIGDVNNDGKITATDVRWVLQFVSSLREFSDSQIKAADINGDGKVTAMDSRILLLNLAEE